jgi:hypothetical protein
VYILAASHSGSTLLAMLLGSHPEVCTVGELKATCLGDVDGYRCSCGQPIKRCRFWAEVSAVLGRRGFTFDVTAGGADLRWEAGPYVGFFLQPLHRGRLLEALRDAALAVSPAWRARIRRIQRLDAALAQCLCNLTGKRIVVDSSKVGIRLKYLLRNPALDVRVIRLVRDGRAVALAYTDPARYADAKDPHLWGGGMGAKRDSERLPMAAAAHEWRRSNEEAEAILRHLEPTRWTEARYEELCADPPTTLGRLFAFMGVDAARAAPMPHKGEHHVVGNGMRLDADLKVRFDDRWKRMLTRVELKGFDSVAGKMNQRYGYS